MLARPGPIVTALVACVLASAAAFSAGPARPRVHSPSAQPCMTGDCVSRRVAVGSGLAMGFGIAIGPGAEMAGAADYALTKDYTTDATNLIENMRYATNLTRGETGFENTVTKTRKEMSDFVSYYRRQQRYAGAQSFNTLYTAVNTLSGHYASFGNSYPVPAKRRERLTVQYKEIEKYLKKGR